MIQNLRLKWITIIVVLVSSLAWVLPNFIDRDLEDDKNWWGPSKKIVKGLDIQGGLHLVMGVNVDEVLIEKTVRLASGFKKELTEEGITVDEVSVAPDNKKELVVTTEDGQVLAEVEKYIADIRYADTLQIVSNDGKSLRLRYYDAKALEYKRQVVEQAIEVIRTRIDGIGVAEPSISAQGNDRILVQLPGIKNASQAKELINRTARLNFRVVHQKAQEVDINTWIDEAEKAGGYELGRGEYTKYSVYLKKLNADLESKLPKNTKVVFEKLDGAKDLQTGRRAYLIETDTGLSGDLLDDANVRPDQYGGSKVTFDLSVEGRRRFSELTQKAAGGLLAIVLDDVVKSAPSVERQIDNSSAEITLGSTRNYQESLNEANFIATALRAGALPAALEQLEERTVGPTLGHDSIERGKKAGIIGAILVLVFMLVYYKFLGLVANVALTFNVLLILSILSSLGATLTLPGVAGIVLTMGMAVDANVIIFERIKEELRKGSGLMSAVQNGFGQAFSAILDANITTAAVCIVLMYFGTGPVRGFAVTLICGIVTSMFTAIFVSRAVIELSISHFGLKKIVAVKGVE